MTGYREHYLTGKVREVEEVREVYSSCNSEKCEKVQGGKYFTVFITPPYTCVSTLDMARVNTQQYLDFFIHYKMCLPSMWCSEDMFVLLQR